MTNSIQSHSGGSSGKKPRIIVIVGPTASGKSALALSIAESCRKKNINSAVINADSQQMYRELRILTARPTPEEEARAPHRLYGTLGVAELCSAGHWLKLAQMEIDWTLAQGGLPLVVGGTGLYIRALLQGIADIPDIAPQVRAQARSDMQAMGHEAFHERLRAVDPVLADRLRTSDTQRLVRAYEVWLGTGRPLSWWQGRAVTPPYPSDSFEIYQVDMDRKALYERCDARFRAMVEQGAIEEVKQLLALRLPPGLPAMKSVGVKELAAYIGGECSLEEAIAMASQATRHYAKRQLTWMRHQLKDWSVYKAVSPLTVDLLDKISTL